MVWSHKAVEDLRQKFKDGEEITVQERKKLEKYIRLKKQNQEKKLGVNAGVGGDWAETQILRAEKLLHDIKQRQGIQAEVKN